MTAKKREVKRYDWDALFSGTDVKMLTRGKDFTGTTRAAAAMVRYRARERDVKWTAEVVDNAKIRVLKGDPHAGRAGAKPKPKPKKAKIKKAKPKTKTRPSRKAKASAKTQPDPDPGAPAITDVPPPPA